MVRWRTTAFCAQNCGDLGLGPLIARRQRLLRAVAFCERAEAMRVTRTVSASDQLRSSGSTLE